MTRTVAFLATVNRQTRTVRRSQPSLVPWRNADLATIRFEEPGAGAAAGDTFTRSWVQLLPEGRFDHPKFGKIDLSRRVLDEIKANFDKGVRRAEIALDYDHRAADGDSRAAGWIEALEYRAANGETPAGLWGKVRWTPIGLKDVQDQIYRYLSAEYRPQYTDNVTGRKYRNVLVGLALTNRPFMNHMEAIRLAELAARGRTRMLFERPGHYTRKDREKIPDEDFAGPNRTFPIVTQQDVHDAARLIGHAANPAAVTARIKAIAKRKGFSLPKEWQDESDGKRGTNVAASERAARTRTVGRHGVRGKRKQEREEEREDEDLELDEGEEPEDSDDGEDPEDGELAFDDGMDDDEEYAEGDDEEEDEPADDEDQEDEEEPPAKPKAKAKRKPARKMSEAEAKEELIRLREEHEAMARQLAEHKITKKLDEWRKSTTRAFAERAAGDTPEARRLVRAMGDLSVGVSKRFADKYRKLMLGTGGIRLSESTREKLDEVIELALTSAVVDLSRRSPGSYDQEKRKTSRERARGGEVGPVSEEADRIALDEEKISIERLALREPEKAEKIMLRAADELRRRGELE